jgi:hypothetical protein
MSRKLKIMAMAATISALVSGCMFEPEPYRPVHYYDLKTPWKVCPEGVDVDVQLFRMEAPSKYKMLYRADSTKVLVDDYNKWTQPPGFMLTRYLQSAFSSDTNPEKLGNIVFVMTGSIFTFEIDLEKSQAVLGVKYELKRKRDGKILIDKSRVFYEKFPDSKKLSPEIFANAMSDAATQFVKKLRGEIISIKDQEKQALLKEKEKIRKKEMAEEKAHDKKLVRESEIDQARAKAIIEKAEADRMQAELDKEKTLAELNELKKKMKEFKKIKDETEKIKKHIDKNAATDKESGQIKK